jgi:hypothetical protein
MTTTVNPSTVGVCAGIQRIRGKKENSEFLCDWIKKHEVEAQ